MLSTGLFHRADKETYLCAAENGLEWRTETACKGSVSRSSISPRRFPMSTHRRGAGLHRGGSVSGWPPCGQKRGRGRGGRAPGYGHPMRMAAISTGSGQRGNGEAVKFFDYAALLFLRTLSPFRSGRARAYTPIPPYLGFRPWKKRTPEEGPALIARAPNFRGRVCLPLTVNFLS